MQDKNNHIGRPPRITPFTDQPLYYITFNTHNRLSLLANEDIHARFINFASKAETKGAAIGRYVIMPDHIHLFLRCHHSLRIGDTIRLLKRSLSASIKHTLPHWQPGFFDHIIRQGESYHEKWLYVEQNPVRAELVETADAWPFQGQVVDLRM
jgi:putative transposase